MACNAIQGWGGWARDIKHARVGIAVDSFPFYFIPGILGAENTNTVQRHRSSCRTCREFASDSSAGLRLGGATHTQAAERRRRVGLRVVHVVDERLEVRSRGLHVVGQQ
eukprot:scaffold46232_cov58-Phaeocystis_antarctica.AAC.1